MKKITILFGAGAALSWNAPSTEIITNAIKDSTDHFVGTESFGKWVDFIVRKYNYNPQYNKVNFETYIDFIETIWNYFLEKDANSPSSKKSNLYRAFDLKSEIEEGIHKLKWTNNSSFNSETSKIAHAFYSFLRIIENRFNNYLVNYESNNFEKNKKLQLFCEHFIKVGYSLRSYSLNYDRSVPLVFESNKSQYEIFDGFDIKDHSNKAISDFFLLNKSRILSDINSHTYYNLHGSFHYSYQDCGYKGFRNSSPFTLMLSKKYRNNFSKIFALYDNPAKANSNETLLQSNIITGYKKIQRVNLEPFNYFFHSFFNDVQTSEIIIIVGYSYSDPHINNLLKEANRKNVRIYNITFRNLTSDNLVTGYMGDFGVILKNNYPNINNWSKDVEYFYSEYIKGFDNFLTEEEWLNIQPF